MLKRVPDVGVEALDGPEQAEVALLDQVLQRQALADVAAGDVDDQAQVGPDHPVAGLRRRPRAIRWASIFSSSAVRRAISLISRR